MCWESTVVTHSHKVTGSDFSSESSSSFPPHQRCPLLVDHHTGAVLDPSSWPSTGIMELANCGASWGGGHIYHISLCHLEPQKGFPYSTFFLGFHDFVFCETMMQPPTLLREENGTVFVQAVYSPCGAAKTVTVNVYCDPSVVSRFSLSRCQGDETNGTLSVDLASSFACLINSSAPTTTTTRAPPAVTTTSTTESISTTTIVTTPMTSIPSTTTNPPLPPPATRSPSSSSCPPWLVGSDGPTTVISWPQEAKNIDESTETLTMVLHPCHRKVEQEGKAPVNNSRSDQIVPGTTLAPASGNDCGAGVSFLEVYHKGTCHQYFNSMPTPWEYSDEYKTWNVGFSGPQATGQISLTISCDSSAPAGNSLVSLGETELYLNYYWPKPLKLGSSAVCATTTTTTTTETISSTMVITSTTAIPTTSSSSTTTNPPATSTATITTTTTATVTSTAIPTTTSTDVHTTTTSYPASTSTPSSPIVTTTQNPAPTSTTTTPPPTKKIVTPPTQLCGSHWFNDSRIGYDIEFTPCQQLQSPLASAVANSDASSSSSSLLVYNASTGALLVSFDHVTFDWTVNSSGLFIQYSSNASNGVDLATVEIECDPGQFELIADFQDSGLGNLKDVVFILKSAFVCFSTTTTPTTAPRGSPAPGSSTTPLMKYLLLGGICLLAIIVTGITVCCVCRRRTSRNSDAETEEHRRLLQGSGVKGSQEIPATMVAKTYHGFDEVAGTSTATSLNPSSSHHTSLPNGQSRSKFLSIQQEEGETSHALLAEEDEVGKAAGASYTMTLERFNRGRQIGRGAFGTVYQGVDSATGRQVAAKELAFKSPIARERLLPGMLREVVLLKELKHTNIVRYLGHDCREGELSLWIFMEYLSGGSLRSVIDSLQQKLSPNVAAGYTKQILRGLSYIHKRGFVHRDLKADNILSDVNGVMKLADFGTTMSEESVTRMVGTPCWMAPEVVTEEEGGIGTPSDIWSLGCIVIEMLTKCEYPFSWLGKSQMVMSKLASGDRGKVNEVVDSARELCTKTSPEGWDFVKKCLAFSPKDRPTAQQLLVHPFVKLADSN